MTKRSRHMVRRLTKLPQQQEIMEVDEVIRRHESDAKMYDS